MDFDLTSYKNYDPNTIYHDGSATFIYSRSGELYFKTYPTTHIDMLLDNDNIFDDVFEPEKPLSQKEKLSLAKERPQQEKHAIFGRFAVESGDIIIAIWNKMDHYLFPSFIKTLIQQYPAFKDRFVVVIGKEQQPKLLSDLLNIEPPKKKVTVSLTPKKQNNKKYLINGREYTINDLANLRKKAHTTAWEWDHVKDVLCHPDMKKYPELEPYIPARCSYSVSSKPKWSDWIRVGAYEHINFKDWLLVEHILFESTVSQVIKTHKQANEVWEKIKDSLYDYQSLPPDTFQALKKWAIYQYIFRKKLVPHNMTVLFADKEIVKKLNNIEYTPENLQQDDRQYHQKLQTEKQKQWKGNFRQADPPLILNGLEWISLDSGYEAEYGTSMGHCGNAACKRGDNIWSLYDPNTNIHYLTFIVNNQVLGESKGRNNQKPHSKFLPNIKQLLLATDQNKPIVLAIRGGGYKPENNFQLTDLPEQDQQEILKLKPNMDCYVSHAQKQYAKVPKGFTPNHIGKYHIEDDAIYFSKRMSNDDFDNAAYKVFQTFKDIYNERDDFDNQKKIVDVAAEYYRRKMPVPNWLMETMISSETQSYLYAGYVLAGRNVPDQIVASLAHNAQYAEEYASEVLRFKNVPQVVIDSIADNEDMSYKYAKKMNWENVPEKINQSFLQSRHILKYLTDDEDENDKHPRDLEIKKPVTPEIIEALSKNSSAAYRYAQINKFKDLPQSIIDAIEEDPSTAYAYFTDFGNYRQEYDKDNLEHNLKNMSPNMRKSLLVINNAEKICELCANRCIQPPEDFIHVISMYSESSLRYAEKVLFKMSMGTNWEKQDCQLTIPNKIVRSIANSPDDSLKFMFQHEHILIPKLEGKFYYPNFPVDLLFKSIAEEPNFAYLYAHSKLSSKSKFFGYVKMGPKSIPQVLIDSIKQNKEIYSDFERDLRIWDEWHPPK